MVKDAEQYADEDKKRREAVDTKNQVCHPGYNILTIAHAKAENAVVEPEKGGKNP